MPIAVMGFAGRALVAILFILAGAAKLLGPRPFLQHMREFQVPGILIAPVIGLELGGGLSLLTGFQAGYAALALAGFCALAASIFHRDLSNKAERTLFFKDIAIAGGLLTIAAAQPWPGVT